MKKPKAAPEDASTIALRAQQVADLSRLDQEENLRVKQLLVAQRGGRFFRGSPLLRAKPSDRAGSGGSGGGITSPASSANLFSGDLGNGDGPGRSTYASSKPYGAY